MIESENPDTVHSSIQEWDTDCFGFKVARVTVSPQANISMIKDHLTQLQSHGVMLVYLVSSPTDKATSQLMQIMGAQLVDVKHTYSKTANFNNFSSNSTLNASIKELEVTTSADTRLRRLAILAGRYSRFNVDKRIPEERFEYIYHSWLTKSISHEIADCVLVARSQSDTNVGLITLSCQNRIGNIGLISVHPDSQGKGIGKTLMQHADNYFETNNCLSASVVTQEKNEEACSLYKKSGYKLEHAEHFYHLWLD